MPSLRDAIILWDRDQQKVMTVGRGVRQTAEMDELSSSGGAAYAFWQEAPTSELYFRMLQQVCSLIRDDGIPFETVHQAFLEIPEYRVTLGPGPDQWEEGVHGDVELPEGWTNGYNLGF
ncbi:MAG: hypothetical protein GQ539_01165 [Sulfitobacter sp.]|nr:hypothetical protein [Sulfitobacter sp.]